MARKVGPIAWLSEHLGYDRPDFRFDLWPDLAVLAKDLTDP